MWRFRFYKPHSFLRSSVVSYLKNIFISLFLLSSLLWSQGYKIQHYTIPSAAVDAQSQSYRTRGGLAEWNSEVSSSESYLIDSGFWGSMYQKLLALDDELLLPEEFTVSPAYPNPFNPTTTIDFAIPALSDMRIVIYDILGREMLRYERLSLEAGYYQFNWHGTDLSGRQAGSGVYIISVSNNEKHFTRKITLLK